MKKFPTKSPCELTVRKMDRSCGLEGCPNCEYGKLEEWKHDKKRLKIIAICKAPWVGGFTQQRPLAIVYECQKCFKIFWFHTTKSHKESLESLLNEGLL